MITDTVIQTLRVALLLLSMRCVCGEWLDHCICFSTCNPHDAQQFLARLPDSVRSKEDPYYAYLMAVYGGDVTLPFPLSKVNFFYHSDARWRAQHPEVQWPMATCDIPKHLLPAQPLSQRMKKKSLPQRSQPWCSRAVCRRWERRSPAPVQNIVTVVIPTGNGQESTSGAVLFEQPLHPTPLARLENLFGWDRSLRGRQVYPSNTWMEVIRLAKLEENGTDSWYGFWFFQATGSGI